MLTVCFPPQVTRNPYYNQLMARCRAAIVSGYFTAFADSFINPLPQR